LNTLRLIFHLPASARARLVLAAAAFVFLLQFTASAQNTLTWRTNFYSVTGETLREVRQSMQRARPWQDNTDLVGLTQWRIDWRFNVVPTANGCRCASFTTTTSITNTLPRWVPPTNAPTELRTGWTRFITSLAQHEDGHSRMSLAAVAELHKKINEAGEAPDCEQMKQKLNGIAQRVIDDFRARDREYDRRTGHGATQGAQLR
jgi:predicted secreted Zn-dependent protease